MGACILSSGEYLTNKSSIVADISFFFLFFLLDIGKLIVLEMLVL